MAQGKAWDKQTVVELLEPLLKLGYSLTKACDAAGIPRTTVQTWVDQDEELRLKVSAWKNEPNVAARKNLISEIGKGNSEASKWWLERKEKEDFSLRQELTGSDGGPVVTIDAGKNPYADSAKKFLPDEN